MKCGTGLPLGMRNFIPTSHQPHRWACTAGPQSTQTRGGGECLYIVCHPKRSLGLRRPAVRACAKPFVMATSTPSLCWGIRRRPSLSWDATAGGQIRSQTKPPSKTKGEDPKMANALKKLQTRSETKPASYTTNFLSSAHARLDVRRGCVGEQKLDIMFNRKNIKKETVEENWKQSMERQESLYWFFNFVSAYYHQKWNGELDFWSTKALSAQCQNNMYIHIHWKAWSLFGIDCLVYFVWMAKRKLQKNAAGRISTPDGENKLAFFGRVGILDKYREKIVMRICEGIQNFIAGKKFTQLRCTFITSCMCRSGCSIN